MSDRKWKFLRGRTGRYVTLKLWNECGDITARPLYIVVRNVLRFWSLDDIDPQMITHIVSAEDEALALAMDMTQDEADQWNMEDGAAADNDTYIKFEATRLDCSGKGMVRLLLPP